MTGLLTIWFKSILSVVIIFILAATSVSSENISSADSYIYGLTYSGLNIANISFSESDYYPYDGADVKSFECEVETFSDLLKFGGKYRSIVARDNSVKYYRDEHDIYDGTRILEYWFDYDKNLIEVKDRRIVRADTTNRNFIIENIDGKYSDSISLFFRLRESLDTLTTPVHISYFNGSDLDSLIIESITPEIFELSESKTIPVLAVTARIPAGLMPGSRDKIKLYISDDAKSTLIYGRMYMTLGYLELKLLSEF